MIVGLSGSSASAFDLDHWGLWADGADENDAVAALGPSHDRFATFLASHGATCDPIGEVTVLERQPPHDEGAFAFEREPATDADRERTLQLYQWARDDLVGLITNATDDELDWIDASRRLPEWAWWRTARQMAWHCAITETCYYLDRVGIARPEPFAVLTSPLPAPPTDELLELLALSGDHVEHWIERLPATAEVAADGEVWTTRKVLRRLAGHERAENDVTSDLILRSRTGRR